MFGESSGILCPVLCDTREIGIWQFCIEEIDPRVTDMNHKRLSCQPPEGAIFGTAPWGLPPGSRFPSLYKTQDDILGRAFLQIFVQRGGSR
jgi:hypothetical protein